MWLYPPYTYAFRDVCRIQGLTREVVVALIANIESRSWRDSYNVEHGIALEHPRSSTTDDVECFFSILRDMVGASFTLKQVYTSIHIIILC